MTLIQPNETRPRPDGDGSARLARRTVVVAAIVGALLLLVLVAYTAASALLLIFAALLIAAIFCGLARLLQRLGLPRWLSLLLVYLFSFALLIAPVAWGGVALVQQFSDLLTAVRDQAGSLLARAGDLGLPVERLTQGGSEGDAIQSLLPNSGGLVSQAGTALFALLGGIGNVFVVLFLAVFISWQPEIYRDGLVSLLPKAKRRRVAEVLDQSAHSLILWVLGDAISMTIIFTVSWIGLSMIGMNNSFLLALQAGLLAFIPTLGPFVAGVIIVLAGLAQGAEMALWALGVYLLIQGVESNVAQPIAQRWTSSLPPALTLSVQIVFGILFGVLGFVLAVPIVAVMVTLVRELYVEDVLGGPVETVEAAAT